MNGYWLIADVVAIVHAAYVAFVVVGFVLIVAGIPRGWRWVRRFWFRTAHLLAIGFVWAGSLAGIPCPLTTLEGRLREAGGATGYSRDFIGWVDRLIFYDFPPRVFTIAYAAFGLLVAATFIWARPRWPGGACRTRDPGLESGSNSLRRRGTGGLRWRRADRVALRGPRSPGGGTSEQG
jgi:Protein of Unknown function (DUF2784)